MMVRFDVTVVSAGPTEGVLNGIPVGANQVVYVSLEKLNYAGDAVVGGSVTTTAVQRIAAGTVVGNVTFNEISLTHQKYLR